MTQENECFWSISICQALLMKGKMTFVIMTLESECFWSIYRGVIIKNQNKGTMTLIIMTFNKTGLEVEYYYYADCCFLYCYADFRGTRNFVLCK
jgi:hypothetical protein